MCACCISDLNSFTWSKPTAHCPLPTGQRLSIERKKIAAHASWPHPVPSPVPHHLSCHGWKTFVCTLHSGLRFKFLRLWWSLPSYCDHQVCFFLNFFSVHRTFLPSFDPHTQSQVAPVLGPPLQECMPRFRKFHVVPSVHHRIITSCYRARKQSCNLPTVSILLWFQKETDTFSLLS